MNYEFKEPAAGPPKTRTGAEARHTVGADADSVWRYVSRAVPEPERVARVERLKQEYKEGRYQVSAAELSRCLVKEILSQ
jgi:anti-sigma28 factor (negative regulator of flagellin synthesis)